MLTEKRNERLRAAPSNDTETMSARQTPSGRRPFREVFRAACILQIEPRILTVLSVLQPMLRLFVNTGLELLTFTGENCTLRGLA
jgi:hypothetical protein